MTNDGLRVGHSMAALAAAKAGEEWSRAAYEAFVQHARKHRYFVTEDVRLAAGLRLEPPDRRAWGQIALKARRDGIVVGHRLVRAKSKSVHGMIVTQWESLIAPE